ncbi:MAG TPA: ABC transporter permease [Dermatophilaceae bacterium]|nr:ABC transporter permease [Dermatophilaceae bacterium]
MSTATSAARASRAVDGAEDGQGSRLSGIPALVRLAVRRDRVWWPAWIVPLAGYTAATAAAYEGLYPTAELRRTITASMGSNATLRAMYGLPYDLESPGGFTAWRIGAMTCVLVAVMSVLTVVRHTREEEETGRLELVRAGVVGRHAALAAAVLVTVGGNLVLGLAATAGLVAVGTPLAGATALGAGFASVGLVFTGVGAVGAQLSESTRSARGIGLGALTAAFLAHSVGDTNDDLSWLAWSSPVAWANRVRPYAGERWWVLLLPAVTAAVLLVTARLLEASRDFAAGALPARLGPARGAGWFGSPVALAWRLQRGSLLAWTVGLAVMGAAVGAIAPGVIQMFEGNPTLAAMLRQLGGSRSVVDAYLAYVFPVLATIGTAHSIQAVLRLRTEEAELRAEQVLATAVTRTAFAGSHLALAIVSPVVLMTVAGLCAGLGYGIAVGDLGVAGPVAAAALVSIPAVWVLTGLTMLCLGARSTWAGLVWAAYGLVVLIGQVGQLLRFPDWLLWVSPYRHVPALPGGELSWPPLVGLTLVAAALLLAGVAAYRHRDIG